MSKRIDRFSYIGDIENAADQTRELLSHVGLWDSHGKHFINGGIKIGRSPYCNLASHPSNHTAAHVGFLERWVQHGLFACEKVEGEDGQILHARIASEGKRAAVPRRLQAMETGERQR
jgi:hypothetical protein